MTFDLSLCRNESEVESKLIVQYLLPNLGYSPDTWHQEVALGSIRLDFLAFASQVIHFNINSNYPLALVIEAKSPKENLNNHARKLKQYLKSMQVSYGLLTNGKKLRIHQIHSNEFTLIFQCLGSEIETKITEIKKIVGREEIRNQQQPIDTNNLTNVTNVTNLTHIKITQEKKISI